MMRDYLERVLTVALSFGIDDSVPMRIGPSGGTDVE